MIDRHVTHVSATMHACLDVMHHGLSMHACHCSQCRWCLDYTDLICLAE